MTEEIAPYKTRSKPQLHVSALGMKCMEAFRRRYIEREVIPPGVALVVGTGTHRGVDVNMHYKIETGDLLPIEAVADAARDGVNHAWEKDGVKLEPDEVARGVKAVRGEAIDKAVRLATLHAKEKAPRIFPIHAERPWSLEIKGYPLDLVGRLDIQEADTVRDTKTSGKTPSEDVAEKSLQLKAYALAVQVLDGKAPGKVFLDYLIDTKTPKTATFEHSPDIDDFQAVLNRVEVISMAMTRGVFVPVEPDHWCCSEKFCGYWNTCKYIRRPKQFAAWEKGGSSWLQ
ncbi:MAG TPA: PD-(D/E)XK nuclease family protein [Acidobacteriota bacterium]|nr:PD-(D/E)XK nuclease family protein [Acidobacteriota bacterium]